jgi:hypothetical protein
MQMKKDKTDLALMANESVAMPDKPPKYETEQWLKTRCTKTDAKQKSAREHQKEKPDVNSGEKIRQQSPQPAMRIKENHQARQPSGLED